MLFSSTLLLLNQEQSCNTNQCTSHLTGLQTCSRTVCNLVSQLHSYKGWERNHRKLWGWYIISQIHHLRKSKASEYYWIF